MEILFKTDTIVGFHSIQKIFFFLRKQKEKYNGFFFFLLRNTAFDLFDHFVFRIILLVIINHFFGS